MCKSVCGHLGSYMLSLYKAHIKLYIESLKVSDEASFGVEIWARKKLCVLLGIRC